MCGGRPEGATLSHDIDHRRSGKHERGEALAKLLIGRIVCIVGLILAIGGAVSAVFLATANISAEAVGIVLGILGYFLGAGRLAVATIVISVIALFFGLAASQGLIPGIEQFDRNLPSRNP